MIMSWIVEGTAPPRISRLPDDTSSSVLLNDLQSLERPEELLDEERDSFGLLQDQLSKILSMSPYPGGGTPS